MNKNHSPVLMMEDHELSRILEELAEKYATQKVLSKCCDLKLPLVYEPKSPVELEEIIDKCRLVVVNFYSTNCPYCMVFHRIYEATARRYYGRAVFLRYNVEYDPSTAWNYNVMGTPTTIIFVDRNVSRFIPGYVPLELFENVLLEEIRKARC